MQDSPLRAAIAIGAALILVFLQARPSSADQSLAIRLEPVNNSGISGMAVLSARGNQTQIDVTIDGEPAGASEPIHIHNGNCGSALGSIKYPLKNVENGASTTVVDAPLGSLLTGGFAINAHQSAANITTWIACGNVPSATGSYVWSSEKALPVPRAMAGLAVASDGHMFLIGGSSTHRLVTPRVDELDPSTGAWRTRAPLPSARRSLGVAMATNGKIYAVGGVGSGGEALATVEEYDAVKNSWQPRQPMPTARGALGLIGTENGKIYAIGGTPDGREALATVEEYDPATNTWSARAKMPTPRADAGLSIAPDGRIYVVGGTGSDGAKLSIVEAYDPSTDKWETRAPMLTARSALGVVTSSNLRVYAIGGSSGSVDGVATIEAYDPTANTWTAVAPAPLPIRSLSVAASDSGKLYLFGGCCLNDEPVDAVWVGTAATLATLLPTVSPELTANQIAATAVPTAPVEVTEQPTAAATLPPAPNPTIVPTSVPTTAPSATAVAPARAALPTATTVATSTPAAALAQVTLPDPRVWIGIGVVAAVALGSAFGLRRARATPPPAADSTPIGSMIVTTDRQTADAPPGETPTKPMLTPPSAPRPSPQRAATSGPRPSEQRAPPPPPTEDDPAETVTGPPINGSQVGDNLRANPPRIPAGFQVVGRPGRGGFGVVYKAYQESLDRYVAIKVISPHLSHDPSISRRFREEALRTARLEHPNIVPIYGFGQADNGSLYIIMRYVDGMSLQELLSREKVLAIARANRIIRQVADALDYAHTRGVIHRDVKPSNILVEIGDRVTLVDFGIARVLDQPGQTARGVVIGTPKYLAPEQMRGERIDGRTDLYAMALVYYELLAGRSPFGSARPEVRLNQTIPSPLEFRPDIPASIVEVLMTALEPDRNARYPSVADFTEAFDNATNA